MVAGVYGVSFKLGILPLLGVLALGSAAISAPGTLYAAMAVQARARDALLAFAALSDCCSSSTGAPLKRLP